MKEHKAYFFIGCLTFFGVGEVKACNKSELLLTQIIGTFKQ